MFGKKNPDPKTGVDYEQLGRSVEAALIKDYIYLLRSTKRQIWSAFVRGVFTGFGSVIGATLVVALALAILNLLGGAPFIGQYIKDIGDSLSH